MGKNLPSPPRAGLFCSPACWLLIWLLFWAFGLPGLSRACEIIAVKSDALPLYDKTLSGIESVLPCRITSVPLSPSKGKEVLELIEDRNPDAVVAVGTYAFRKLRNAKIPNLVYTMAIPYEVENDSPGSITGVGIIISPEVYIENIVEVFGSIRRLGVLYSPGKASGYAREIFSAARARGVEVLPIEVHSVEDVPPAFRELRSRPDVLLMLPDPAVASPEALNAILLYSFQNSIPLVSFARKYVTMGAVLSLEVDPFDIGVQTGELIGKILKEGRSSARKLYARKVRLTINQKVAQKMSLPLRESSLKRAEIIR
ncbi:MAG: hypothetical protein K8I29_02355 [Alphaproteobacteria bacterium]|uniref:ABC transporter substrate-binding protein n=1 Tax=Candidatus Nitrobium versatile TaxID=2884831 RepID=A0A953LVN0_9BACT|nr:hypothetical protein [Candidatus Nitrobium versatile]